MTDHTKTHCLAVPPHAVVVKARTLDISMQRTFLVQLGR
jgi:hypothetical protein